MSKAGVVFSRLESVNSNKLGLRFVLFKMWNSPRFCFNSYLELDGRMRMRARCAAWQLWVSEKFSLVINARSVYTRSTPKTHFRDDTMKITNWLEQPEEVRVGITGAQGPQCLPLQLGAVGSPLFVCFGFFSSFLTNFQKRLRTSNCHNWRCSNQCVLTVGLNTQACKSAHVDPQQSGFTGTR